ncbi:hypothetical protein ACFWII_38330 [Streptomyces sp. NPDC127063]|uniref:hypothetical protein n=1 Tax=Streptomyces sp. NPDC127063 TaxID=3347123 RepID=UPI003664E078
MNDPAPLTARQTARLITALQQGQDLDDAAAVLRIELSSVWARARTDTRLTIALAGRDPDSLEERGRTRRAEYLRLLALGVSPSRAELILGVPGTDAWRSSRTFARACDAVSAQAAAYMDIGRPRLTPQWVKRFLEAEQLWHERLHGGGRGRDRPGGH